MHIWFEFALRVKTEFPGSRTKILTHSNSTYEEEKKQIVAKLLDGDHRMVREGIKKIDFFRKKS